MAIDFNKVNEAKGKSGHKTATAVKTKNGGVDGYQAGVDSVVVVGQDYDLEKIKKLFKLFDKQIDQARSGIEGFEITNDEDAAQFVETLGVASRMHKAIEAKRKEIIFDADKYVRGVNNFVRLYRVRVEKLISTGKAKVGDWSYKKELKRREDEKKMREEAEKKQKEIDEAAKKAGIETVTLPPVVTPKKQMPIRTGTSTGSTRMKKVGKVVDFAALGDEYKIADMKKIQAAVDAGICPKGVEIKEEPKVSIRSG